MQIKKIISGIAAVIDSENIDTDQIIPAEYLKITHKTGLGKHLFDNWRYQNDGSENSDFVLNQKVTCDASVLIAGDNFGCGSSREHAPWSLLDFGIQAVISTSIADIFKNNAVKNGLLPIVVEKEIHSFLMQKNAKDIQIDIEEQKITVDEQSFNFSIEPFTRYCFLNGLDQLQFLMNQQEAIKHFENKHQIYRQQ